MTYHSSSSTIIHLIPFFNIHLLDILFFKVCVKALIKCCIPNAEHLQLFNLKHGLLEPHERELNVVLQKLPSDLGKGEESIATRTWCLAFPACVTAAINSLVHAWQFLPLKYVTEAELEFRSNLPVTKLKIMADSSSLVITVSTLAVYIHVWHCIANLRIAFPSNLPSHWH